MGDRSPRYTMKAAATLSGLNPHTIRVWERRYGAVRPERTQSDRRLYSPQEVQRLRLLHEATRLGHGISQLANLPDEALERLLSQRDTSSSASACSSSNLHLQAAQDAVHALNPELLERALLAARAELSALRMLDDVISPLLHWAGDEWEKGTLSVAHEHAMSAVMAPFLVSLRDSTPNVPNAPPIIIGTPSGQLHEFGAQMAAIVAAAEGWQVVYLGPNLPVEDFSIAARHTGARVVAMSMIYPGDTPRLRDALQRLLGMLPKDAALIAGGKAAQAYLPESHDNRAHRCHSLPEFRYLLRNLRATFLN